MPRLAGKGVGRGVQAARRMKLTMQADTEADHKVSEHVAGLHLGAGIRVGF